VPAGAGTYRLVSEVDSGWGRELGSRVRGEWTFRADQADPRRRTPLPLLDARFDLPLDGNDAASASEPLTGVLQVATQVGARAGRIGGPQVAVSFDDGGTWQPAGVRADGGRWTGSLPAGGKPGGYVALRVSASDDHGNAVTETTIRAYRLK
jgi:hypothetical protein